MRARSFVTAALFLASFAGCRLHVAHVKDGSPLSEEKLAHLELGKTTLDGVLLVAGAPDGLEWGYTEDTLVYDSATTRQTRWVLDNPYSYVSGFSPQGAVGELVGYVMFAMDSSGRPLPTRPPGAGRPGTPPFPGPSGGYGKPLKLNSDATGWEEFRFTFDRETEILLRVEVSRGTPRGGVGGVAGSTFLR